MSIISEIKCARCDRKYSGIRSRCPYCGARRIGRGKFSEDTDNSRGKMLIGVLIMAVLVVAAGILLFTTPPSEAPDNSGALAQTPPSASIPDDLDNESMDGIHEVDPPDTPGPSESSPPTTPPAPQVRSVDIVYGRAGTVKTDITEKIGVKLPLRARIEPLGTTDEIIWKSSDEKVFQVTPSNTEGMQVTVVGVGVGTATLTVTVGNVEAKCIIRMKR